MANLVLTLIGDDRPGLVSALSGVVADRGGNWLTSELARLAGKFAGVVLIDVPEDQMAGLAAALSRLGESEGLQVSVSAAHPGASPGAPGAPGASGVPAVRCALALVGNDRPGIVRELSAVLAGQGVSIEALHTSTREAPMAGGQLFEARALLALPEASSLDGVRAALEAIAAELMVDIDLTDA